MSKPSKLGALWPFIIISITYLLFTTTDGAVRMIVLLHAYNKGFTAMEVAVMFTMYELMGAITNLAAGVAGAKWGIRATLVAGLLLQIGGLGMLYGWDDAWSKAEAIVYVTLAQALCGVAKDLTKLGGKPSPSSSPPRRSRSPSSSSSAVSPGTRTRSRASGTSWAPRFWTCRTSRPFT